MSGKKGSKHGNSIQKFLEIISSIQPNTSGCLIWPFGKDKDGYGYYSIKKKTYIAHRLLYGIFFPDELHGHVIMHSCDVRDCCNIHHLDSGSVSENTKDMIKKKRNVKGSLVGTSWLTEDQVEKIRQEYPKKSGIELAKEYGVCKQTIYNAINEDTFKLQPRKRALPTSE